MPDSNVETIRDEIFYQYSKIIAKSALGENAKRDSYGFIKRTFLEMKSGKKKWSEITREDKQFVQSEKKCIYCGNEKDLQWEHIVPKSLKINERCPSCEKIQGIHNQIWSCGECNRKKKTKGLYEFMKERNPKDKKYYDKLPELLEKKYLKTIYWCHECAGTLDKGDIDGDGKISVSDIDHVLK